MNMVPVSFFFRKLASLFLSWKTWDSDGEYPFFRNPLIRIVIVFSLVVILAACVAAYFFIVRSGNETIVLHYNAYFGVDIVGSPRQAFFLPGVAAVFLLANTILAVKFYAGRERIAAHMLLFAALFASVSSGIAIAALSFINI